jgi:hypothetical protein
LGLFFTVPVVAIFTKFDALEDVAYQSLEDEGVSEVDARAQAPARAVNDFEKMYLDDLYRKGYPPRGHVYLRGKNFVLYVCLHTRDLMVEPRHEQEGNRLL